MIHPDDMEKPERLYKAAQAIDLRLMDEDGAELNDKALAVIYGLFQAGKATADETLTIARAVRPYLDGDKAAEIRRCLEAAGDFDGLKFRGRRNNKEVAFESLVCEGHTADEVRDIVEAYFNGIGEPNNTTLGRLIAVLQEHGYIEIKHDLNVAMSSFADYCTQGEVTTSQVKQIRRAYSDAVAGKCKGLTENVWQWLNHILQQSTKNA